MKTTPHRFLATGIVAKELTINFLDPDFPYLQVVYALLADGGSPTLGRTVYAGGWPKEVLDALATLQDKVEEFAINSFFDVPQATPPTTQKPAETNGEAESI